MGKENQEIIKQWYLFYSNLTRFEINTRIREINKSSEKIYQKLYQLRALELQMNKLN